jgi:hypothetical protein
VSISTIFVPKRRFWLSCRLAIGGAIGVLCVAAPSAASQTGADHPLARPRVRSCSEAAQQLPGRSGFVSAERLGKRLARSGDPAMSHRGLKRMSDKPGVHYVRVWRRESPDRRLLLDEIA